MTTTEQGLATREYSDNQIRTRIELNTKAGYGLQAASQAQLNTVFLLCQRYDADPLTDITLFEGRPFWTIDGRLRFMRRHPDFRGYDCRPLTRDEKEAWGYEPDDIVIEATVRTVRWGEIKARGKVTRVEVDGARERAQREHKRPAPIGAHPVEIAEKRAIARAERAAFGQDAVPDDDEIAAAAQTVIERRTDPARVALNAGKYEAIFGEDEAHSAYDLAPSDVAAPPDAAGEAASEVDSRSGAAEPPERQVTSKTDPLWKAWLGAESRARQAGLEVETSGVRLPIVESSLRGAIDDLLADVDQRIEQSQTAGQAQAF